MRKGIQSKQRCRGHIRYADDVLEIPSEKYKMVQETLFSHDGFIGSQRLYFIQKDTTTASLAPPIQTRSYSRISDKVRLQ
jgi:hypothetical protein